MAVPVGFEFVPPEGAQLPRDSRSSQARWCPPRSVQQCSFVVTLLSRFDLVRRPPAVMYQDISDSHDVLDCAIICSGDSDAVAWLVSSEERSAFFSHPTNGRSHCGEQGDGQSGWVTRAEVLILAVTVQGLSYREAARVHRVSKPLVHKLHHRWLTEGEAASEARSPAQSPVPSRALPTRSGSSRNRHRLRSKCFRVLRSPRMTGMPPVIIVRRCPGRPLRR